jgi:hypothetical protein
MPSEVLKKKHLPALRKSSATKRRQFEPVWTWQINFSGKDIPLEVGSN